MDDLTCSRESPIQFPVAQILHWGIETHYGTARSTFTVAD